jgi:glycine/D-amino acid oxidase-like deaminating enzyme
VVIGGRTPLPSRTRRLDIVLIEKGELTSGSTWHAAGQCPHFNSSLNMTRVRVYGTELYPKLEALTGHAVSWHACGGIRLACTDEEVKRSRRRPSRCGQSAGRRGRRGAEVGRSMVACNRLNFSTPMLPKPLAAV